MDFFILPVLLETEPFGYLSRSSENNEMRPMSRE